MRSDSRSNARADAQTWDHAKAGEQPKSRDRFTSGLGVFVATLGSAVGLGNIWKFPSVTGQNGGAAFVLVYLAMTVLVGLPVMIAEHAIGPQRARRRDRLAQKAGSGQALVADRRGGRAVGVS